jgi:hypothetical protein
MNIQYTGKSCRLAWEQVCLPIIHRQNEHWSNEEDRLLENLVQIHGAYADKWGNIAANFVCLTGEMTTSRFVFVLGSSVTVYVCKSLHDFRKYSFG